MRSTHAYTIDLDYVTVAIIIIIIIIYIKVWEFLTVPFLCKRGSIALPWKRNGLLLARPTAGC
jgi:hypothetical protein